MASVDWPASPNRPGIRRAAFLTRRQLAAFAIATSLLSGCATVGSERSGFRTLVSVVECSGEFQAHAAEELALLPK